MKPSRNLRKIMGKGGINYGIINGEIEMQMCNDCPKPADNVISFDKFPSIIVCDTCFIKYYVEKDDVKNKYR